MSAYLTMLTAVLVAGQPSAAAAGPSAATGATKSVLIRGKVVGPDGHPATDVFLTAARSAPAKPATAEGAGAGAGGPTISVDASPDGTFEIPVPKQGRYTLLVEPARFLSQQLEVVAPSEALEVKLKAGFIVGGRVGDTAGGFVANLDLTLESADAAATPSVRSKNRQRYTRTDDGGYFRFEGVSRGRYRVCARLLAPVARGARLSHGPCAEVAVERDVPTMLVGPVPAGPSRTKNFGDYNLPGGPAMDPAVRQAQPVPLEP